MTTITIPKKAYQFIIQRQMIIEKELEVLKRRVLEDEEGRIKSAVLRRWEQISHYLDRGGGRSFVSAKKMKEWLRNL